MRLWPHVLCTNYMCTRIRSSHINLAPIWQVQSGANLEFRPIWHLANNNCQSGNGQSGKLSIGFLVPDWTQSGKTLKRQIANSNLGQSGNLGQIETNLARLLWLGQFLLTRAILGYSLCSCLNTLIYIRAWPLIA